MIFKNINSEDIPGLIICSEPSISSSAIRTKETTIDGRDGTIVEKLGYKTRIKNVEIGLKKDANIDKILSYFSGEGDLIFKNENDKVYRAAIYEQVDLERLLRLRKGSVAFYCQPFKYKRNDIFEIIKDNKVKEKEGKYLELSKCAEQNILDLKLKGSTTQSTRSGKNKLPYNYYDGNSKTVNGITFTVNKDRSITANGTATANATFGMVDINSYAITAGSYKLVGENSEYTKAAIRGSYKKTDGTTKYVSSAADFTIEEGSTNVYFYVVILQGETVNNVTFYPMLLNSTETDLTFESGGASPSPDYPAKIENVEGKNKFNYLWFDTTKEVDWTAYQSISSVAKAIPIFIGKGNVATFSSNVPSLSGNNLLYAINDLTQTSSAFFALGKTQTIKANNEGYVYVGYIKSRTNYDKVKDETYYVQVEEGTVATPYVPYNSLEIKDVGENLFDKKTNTILTWLTAAEITEKGSVCSKNFIPTTKNKIYATNFAACVFYYDKKLNYLGNSMDLRTDSGNSYTTWTNPDNNSIAFMKVEYRISNNNLDMTTQEIMLTESETVKVYTSYQEQKVDFPLSEGQKLYKDSYLSSDGIHHKRKQIVLNGTEGIANVYVNTSTTRFGFSLSLTPDKKIGLDNVLSTHFKCDTTVYYDSQTQVGICGNARNVNIYIRVNGNITTDEFKTWLATQYANGTPVILEYELAEEEIIPYIEAQQEAYNQLQKLKLYKGQNTMFSLEGSIINLKYLEDTDEKVENQGNIYSKPIIRLEKTVFKEVEIAINGIRFKYNFEEDDYVEIDCEEMTVQYEGLDRNRRLVIDFEFPKLKEGNNDIIMYDGDCIIKCKRKDRWL